jgi:hypothetical protein
MKDGDGETELVGNEWGDDAFTDGSGSGSAMPVLEWDDDG